MAGCQTKPVLWIKGSGWENWPNGNFSLLNAKLQRACVQMSESSKRSTISASRQSGPGGGLPDSLGKTHTEARREFGRSVSSHLRVWEEKRLSGVMETRLSLSCLEETRHCSSPSQPSSLCFQWLEEKPHAGTYWRKTRCGALGEGSASRQLTCREHPWTSVWVVQQRPWRESNLI